MVISLVNPTVCLGETVSFLLKGECVCISENEHVEILSSNMILLESEALGGLTWECGPWARNCCLDLFPPPCHHTRSWQCAASNSSLLRTCPCTSLAPDFLLQCYLSSPFLLSTPHPAYGLLFSQTRDLENSMAVSGDCRGMELLNSVYAQYIQDQAETSQKAGSKPIWKYFPLRVLFEPFRFKP